MNKSYLLIANITFTGGTLEGINIPDHDLYTKQTLREARAEMQKRCGQTVSRPSGGSPYRINSIRIVETDAPKYRSTPLDTERIQEAISNGDYKTAFHDFARLV